MNIDTETPHFHWTYVDTVLERNNSSTNKPPPPSQELSSRLQWKNFLKNPLQDGRMENEDGSMVKDGE